MNGTILLIALVATGLLAGLVGMAQAQSIVEGTVALEDSPPIAPDIDVEALRPSTSLSRDGLVTIPLTGITDPNNGPLTLTFAEADYTPAYGDITFADFSRSAFSISYTNLSRDESSGTYTVDATQESFSFGLASLVPNGPNTISYSVTDGMTPMTGTITINVSGAAPEVGEESLFVTHPAEFVLGFGHYVRDPDDPNEDLTVTFTPDATISDFDTYLEITDGASDGNDDGTYDITSDPATKLVRLETKDSPGHVVLDYTASDGASTVSNKVLINILDSSDPNYIPLQDVTYMVPAMIDSQFTHTLDQDEIQSLVAEDLSDAEIMELRLDANRIGDRGGFASITGTNSLERTLTYDPLVDDSSEDEVFTYWARLPDPGPTGSRLGAATMTFDRGNMCGSDIPSGNLEFGAVGLGQESDEVTVEIANTGHTPITVMVSGEDWVRAEGAAMPASVTAFGVETGNYGSKTPLKDDNTNTSLPNAVGLNDDVTLYMQLIPRLLEDATNVSGELTQQITVSTTCPT